VIKHAGWLTTFQLTEYTHISEGETFERCAGECSHANKHKITQNLVCHVEVIEWDRCQTNETPNNVLKAVNAFFMILLS
jgi:hypothetical protein